MFIDTHCHLHDEKLADTDKFVQEYLRDGVDIVINAACCADTSEKGRVLAEKYPSVYFMTGCHPSDSNGLNDDELSRIEKLTTHEKCVAIGEIGLDYYWKPFDKEQQKKAFIEQIELADSAKLPICIHCRDATLDTLTILKENKGKLTNGAVMHCFSGSKETAQEILKMGFYISFAGPLTFKNSKTPEVAKYVPIDMCLTETDSPYLAPHPLRGTLNSPKNVSLVAAFLAEIKEMEVERLAECVMTNAKTLFKKL